MPVCIDDLNETHKEQILQFDSFLKSKQREAMNELQGAFDDNKDMKMLDEMYSRSDALQIVRFIEAEVKAAVQAQHERQTHMAGLYLKQLLSQAEDKGSSLNIGLDALGDVNIESAESLGATIGASRSMKLSSMGGEALNPELIKQMKVSEEKAATMQKDFDDLQIGAKQTLKDNVAMMKEIAQVKETLELAKNDGAKLQASISTETKNRVAKLDAIKAELEKVKQELSQDIRKCSQFVQLKSVIQEKNQQVKLARDKVKSLQ